MNKENNFTTIIIVIIFAIGIIFILNNNNNGDDKKYTIKLDDEPYYICGKEIYISNDSYNNELDIDNVIENIETLCNFKNIENAKEDIENLLDDDSYSRSEILQRLQQIYYYYLED